MSIADYTTAATLLLGTTRTGAGTHVVNIDVNPYQTLCERMGGVVEPRVAWDSAPRVTCPRCHYRAFSRRTLERTATKNR